jgi:MoxR-like ATPase
MSEEQVTVDGETLRLPEPFVVLATQNPVDFQGTYPLPEAQLDRFVLRMSMGYPSEDDELAMMSDRRERDPLADVSVVASREDFLALVARARAVHVEPRVAKYLRAIVHATREHDDIAVGVSPRGTLTLLRASQARALLASRDYVSPADVQALAEPVLAHRISLTERARYGGRSAAALLLEVVAQVAVPT